MASAKARGLVSKTVEAWAIAKAWLLVQVKGLARVAKKAKVLAEPMAPPSELASWGMRWAGVTGELQLLNNNNNNKNYNHKGGRSSFSISSSSIRSVKGKGNNYSY